MSEASSASTPYPTCNTPLTLASGTVVRVRNLVVFRSEQSSGLTLYIETPTAAANTTAVMQEAVELVELHNDVAQRLGVRSLTIGVCRTQACLEMREAPQEMFHFERRQDGSWRQDAGESS